MLLSVLAGFLAGFAAPAVNRLGASAGWIVALVPLSVFVYFCGFVGSVSEGETVVVAHEWVPSFGVRLSFHLDGLSLLFALLISGIGALIVVYAAFYLAQHPHRGRFFAFILMFMGSMLGLVLADDVVTLFVFWELTSLTSFLLIGFDHQREAARRAALQALVVTGAGGLLLLAGLLLMAQASGSYALSDIVAGEGLTGSAAYPLILFLVLCGAFTKSAQFPFHFWLANAMEAPTPVSAYLHSATMVKAGVYLLMRLNPALGETVAWTVLLCGFGAATLIVGTLLAVRQTDVKLMLAYTTVASLGLLVMLVGFGSEQAIEAALLYLFAHSLFKGALFMVAGAVDHEAGTRDLTRLRGLRAAMPVTAAAAALAALSMSGIPPFFGFIAKEVVYEALAVGSPAAIALVIAGVFGNALMLAAAAAVAVIPFYGAPVETPRHAHEAPVGLWLGPVLLAALGLVCGLAPGLTGRVLLGPAVGAVHGTPVALDLALWHGFGPALLLSLATVALGIALFLSLARARETVAHMLRLIGWGPDRGFDQVLRGLIGTAVWVTDLLQPGRLHIYMRICILVLAVVLLAPLALFREWPSLPAWPRLALHEWGVLALALGGLYSVLTAHSRVTAIVSLGVQGFAVALIFMLFGAPDLSFTQFMVETLSVIIVTLVLTRLDMRALDPRRAAERWTHGALSIAAGGGLCLTLVAIVQQPFDARLSDFFAEFSYQIAHGRNIVNVIIVDFRALDTLGEITVLLIAGLAITALISLRPQAGGPVVSRPRKGTLEPRLDRAPEVGR